MAQNHLAAETSPYLLQHADNPVHWHPWGPNALAMAQATDKPILLSIGYAACHWCHVMAHESFEDPAIAELMNTLFINIKVDREERPDLDSLYQAALAATGQPGGWPLTMFLNPAGEPFWGGTYFPPQSRYGRPGLVDILKSIAQTYHDHPDKVTTNTTALRQALEQRFRARPAPALPSDLSLTAAQRLAEEFDPRWGGLGEAPKFPNPSVLEFIWHTAMTTGQADLAQPVLRSLLQMAQGGIYDHLGGGFARYAVDSEWLIPHFEKMLYDNALLLHLYTTVSAATGDPLLALRAQETADWLIREMATSDGGYAASYDADSEGEEGRFYVWRLEEIEEILGSRTPEFAAAYDVTPQGNWEGRNILNRRYEPTLASPELEARLAESRSDLRRHRDRRVWPGWDDKILVDWNGLTISALVRAALVFDRADLAKSAIRAFDFICQNLQTKGRLAHAWRLSKTTAMGMIDDYAHMIGASLDLHELTGDEVYIDHALGWISIVDRFFWDPAEGGYFTTADDADDLILRSKSVHDGAVPAGTASLILQLSRAGLVTGQQDLTDRARACLQAFAGEAPHNVFALTTYLRGCENLAAARQIIILGDRADPRTRVLLRAARSGAISPLAVSVQESGEAVPKDHPASGKQRIDGRATAYLCEGQRCHPPICDPDGLRGLLAPQK